MKYFLISAYNEKEMTEKINDKIAAGWELHGSTFGNWQFAEKGDCGQVLFQAMVKKEESPLPFIPITMNHDFNEVIGHVVIPKEFYKLFPDNSLSPGYIVGEDGVTKDLIEFGIVKSEDYAASFGVQKEAIAKFTKKPIQ